VKKRKKEIGKRTILVIINHKMAGRKTLRK